MEVFAFCYFIFIFKIPGYLPPVGCCNEEEPWYPSVWSTSAVQVMASVRAFLDLRLHLQCNNEDGIQL
jgi:hypothetical protein